MKAANILLDTIRVDLRFCFTLKYARAMTSATSLPAYFPKILHEPSVPLLGERDLAHPLLEYPLQRAHDWAFAENIPRREHQYKACK